MSNPRSFNPQTIAVRLVVALVLGIGATAVAITTGAASAPSRPPAAGPITPVTPCSALVGMDFGGGRDVRGQVTSAAVMNVPGGADNSTPFCDVKGLFAPHTNFEIQLPTATWHGQYVQEGCAIWCGSVQLSAYPDAGITCTAVDNGELVLASDDEGHTGSNVDASWAKDSPSQRVVFGLTSEHDLARTSETIITRYYGRPASYTYYDGCSTGGREALILAQRYPNDFDGIIAGAPAANLAPLALFNAWIVRSNTDPNGHQILSRREDPGAARRRCALLREQRRDHIGPTAMRLRPRLHPMRTRHGHHIVPDTIPNRNRPQSVPRPDRPERTQSLQRR